MGPLNVSNYVSDLQQSDLAVIYIRVHLNEEFLALSESKSDKAALITLHRTHTHIRLCCHVADFIRLLHKCLCISSKIVRRLFIQIHFIVSFSPSGGLFTSCVSIPPRHIPMGRLGCKHDPGPVCGEASLFVPEEPSPPSSPLQHHRSTSEVTLRPLSSPAGKPPGNRPVRLPGPVLHAALQEWELMELHGGHRTSGQPLYCQGVFDAIAMGECQHVADCSSQLITFLSIYF